MTAKLQRKGRLPDKHLLQIRIYRDRDPDIYDFLEAIEIGEISGTMKEIIRNGISLVSGQKPRRSKAEPRGRPPVTHPTALANTPPQAASLTASNAREPQAEPEEIYATIPQRVVTSATPMDPDLMRLLAEEDASS